MKDIIKDLFPYRYTCIFCGAEIRDNGLAICNNCEKKLPKITSPCKKCGKQLVTTGDICPNCRNQKPVFTVNHSPYEYTGIIKNIYLKYKFGNRSYLGEAFADILAASYRYYGYHCDCVVGVPSFRKDTARRHPLNHAENLAYLTAKRLGLEYVDDVYKIRETAEQVGLEGKERIANLKNAFGVKNDRLSGKTVLVIDDILTTGSTLDNISKAILKSGASATYGLTLMNTTMKNK